VILAETQGGDIELNSQKISHAQNGSSAVATSRTRSCAIQPCYTRLLTMVGSYKSFQAYLHLHTDMKSDNPVVIAQL